MESAARASAKIHIASNTKVTRTALQDKRPVPLYHGTSSLFLGSILRSGLGGTNPIAEWKVLEFAALIQPLVEKHVAAREDFMVKAQSFKYMVEQKSAAMNFQHGDTYVSPSMSTAVRYAANTRYGSELLTYTLDFLAELIRLKVDGVSDKLYRAYPHIFEKLDISPAPLLIRVDDIDSRALAAENGGDAGPALKHVYETIRRSPEICDVLLQQTNFRLRRPIPATELKIWFIDVVRWDAAFPKYSLYSLSNHDAAPGHA
jgi:hypothetical protein